MIQKVQSIWVTVSDCPRLDNAQVHVWRIHLDLNEDMVERLGRLLSEDETDRAQRFHFDRHRRRYIVSHGFLRRILSGYLAMEPAEINFLVQDRGKPYLPLSDRLLFNMSHSHETALIAVTRDCHIGIDLEHMKRKADVDRLAERFFSKQEYEGIRYLRSDLKTVGFFRLWTLKEACLKATGHGIAGLEGVEFAVSSGNPLSLIKFEVQPAPISCWSIYQFDPLPEYAAAMVVEGQGMSLRWFEPDIHLI